MTASVPNLAAKLQRRRRFGWLSGRQPFARLITCVLLLWIGTDVTLRLFDLRWLNILPQLDAARLQGRYYPFRPNFSGIQNPWTGESALTGNLTPEESRSPVRFSTDELGYRRTPGCSPGSRIDAIVFGGRSMAYGGSLSDEETLPAVLTNQYGIKTYNSGRFFWDVELLEGMDHLLENLGHPRATVVELYWEDVDPTLNQLEPTLWKTDSMGAAILGKPRYEELRSRLQFAKRFWMGWWSVSPAEIVSTRLVKRISDDRILPNPYRKQVQVRTLPGGRRMIFLETEVQRVLHPPDERLLRRNAEYYSHLHKWLQQRGLNLLVVLLPNRYSVYGPITDGAQADPKLPYLDRFQTELTTRGIQTLNCLSLFRDQANSDVGKNDFAFYREDHHWTASGVKRAARAIAGRMATQGRQP